MFFCQWVDLGSKTHSIWLPEQIFPGWCTQAKGFCTVFPTYPQLVTDNNIHNLVSVGNWAGKSYCWLPLLSISHIYVIALCCNVSWLSSARVIFTRLSWPSCEFRFLCDMYLVVLVWRLFTHITCWWGIWGEEMVKRASLTQNDAN